MVYCFYDRGLRIGTYALGSVPLGWDSENFRALMSANELSINTKGSPIQSDRRCDRR